MPRGENLKPYSRKKGDPQTPGMRISSKLSWLARVTLGASGTVYPRNFDKEDLRVLEYSQHTKYRDLLRRAEEASKLLRALAEEIAAFNKSKKLLKMDDYE